MSLQDQLLKLGVANQKQLRQAQHAQRQAAKSGHNEARELAQTRQQEQKAQQQQRQRLLNEERERKENEAAARQMILQNEQLRVAGDAVCHVRVGSKLRKVRMHKAQYEDLCSGHLRWVVLDDRLVLLRAEMAAAIAEKMPDWVLPYESGQAAPAAGYEDARYQIPDDLMW